MQHLLSIATLSDAEIENLLNKADDFLAKGLPFVDAHSIPHQKTIVNCFFEASTRTRISFELAAKRVGFNVIHFDKHNSSVRKGETFLDTIRTLHAMQCNYFVLRQAQNGFCEKLAKTIDNSDIHLINAGEGTQSHPSQALADMLTIQQQKKNFNSLTVAIIGDIKHSRVARSNIIALKKLGVKEIRLIAPEALSLTSQQENHLTLTDNLKAGLADVDVIMLLRMQKERMDEIDIPDVKTYHQQFGLTMKKLKCAKPDAMVMHPGPLNYDVEVTEEVARCAQSFILQQVTNGLAMRMAILQKIGEHCDK